MIKKHARILLFLLCLLAALQVGATTQEIKKTVTAYKYSDYSETPVVELFISNMANQNVQNLDIGTSAPLEELPVFSWNCVGNAPGNIILEFTLSPLALQNAEIAEWLDYTLRLVPNSTKIGTSPLSSSALGPFYHFDATGNELAYYYTEPTPAAEQTIVMDALPAGNTEETAKQTTSITYSLHTTVNPSGNAVETVDHWTRNGTAYIRLDAIPDTASFGTYKATMTISVRGS